MSYDELFTYLDAWTSAFGSVAEKLNYSLADLFGRYEVVIPDEYKSITIFGIMFGVGFSVFIIVSIWRWFKDIIF